MEKDKTFKIPTVKEMQQLRENQSLHILVCERFLKTVTGEEKWNCNHLIRPLQEFVTPSDEAFLMLVLENNEDRWTDEWEKGITKDSDVPAKWTNSGRSKGDGKTRKFCGWAKEGIERFNELMIIVKKDRKMNKHVDDWMLEKWKGMEDEKKNSKRRNNELEESPMVAAQTDFPWEVDDDEDEIEEDEYGPVRLRPLIA